MTHKAWCEFNDNAAPREASCSCDKPLVEGDEFWIPGLGKVKVIKDSEGKEVVIWNDDNDDKK